MCSATRGRCIRRLQPNMRTPVGAAVRHGVEPRLQLCDTERAVERRARYPPARRVCRKRQPCEDPGSFLAYL